jgi:hypothetical protein
VKHLAVCCVILGFLCGGWPCRASESIAPKKELATHVAELARQYQELRARRRQLAPGTRLKELDDYGGRLHKTLSALGVELGHPPQTEQTVRKYLGEPDAVRSQREMGRYLGVYYRGRPAPVRKADERRDRKYLIYFWMGWHDFLFFISEKGVVVHHGWWFAYE